MVLPATHIIAPMLVVEVYRRYFAKERFPQYYTLLAGLAGAAPDFDVILSYIVSFFAGEKILLHRSLSHSVFFAAGVMILAGIVAAGALKAETKKAQTKMHVAAIIIFIVGLSFMMHNLLDCLLLNDAIFLPFMRSSFCPKLLTFNGLGILDGLMVLTYVVFQKDQLRELKKYWRKYR